ncbi:MAG: hypothetical protein ABWY35_12965 [Pseudorhodoplanes sp.]
MGWFSPVGRGHNGRRHALRIITAAAILLGAPPAWTQNEGVGAPNPENALNSSVVTGFLSRFSRPQSAEAAPRTIHKPTQRARISRAKAPIAAPEPEAAAPATEAENPEPPQRDWPNAQDSVGAAGLVPVVIKTVREMIESESQASLVQASDLSDLDIAARPITRLDDNLVATDGRAIADEEWRGSRIVAFAENLKTIGGISWLEPILLALAGAAAAVTAMRVFAA